MRKYIDDVIQRVLVDPVQLDIVELMVFVEGSESDGHGIRSLVIQISTARKKVIASFSPQ